ncbi:CHAT domain-containing protein [Streptomyces sp. LaPpAH-108]|uniref:CHAT domain-containing protein n=1 Tax=Streptomyces sp. LaPpAH-108 TaxID=1155714 RepID=UPI0003791989|nr:CHAT domain-containing protein [Streptomyces sp. LaPpAH-108]
MDIAAHLVADVTESWRARIELPGGGLGIDRIGELDLAGGRPERARFRRGFPARCLRLAGLLCRQCRRRPHQRDHRLGFLMTVFHHHPSVGREPAEALRRAQRWMRDPGRRAPGGFPEPLARAFEDRVARVEASLRERGDTMTAPAHWAGVVHLGR